MDQRSSPRAFPIAPRPTRDAPQHSGGLACGFRAENVVFDSVGVSRMPSSRARCSGGDDRSHTSGKLLFTQADSHLAGPSSHRGFGFEQRADSASEGLQQGYRGKPMCLCCSFRLVSSRCVLRAGAIERLRILLAHVFRVFSPKSSLYQQIFPNKVGSVFRVTAPSCLAFLAPKFYFPNCLCFKNM